MQGTPTVPSGGRDFLWESDGDAHARDSDGDANVCDSDGALSWTRFSLGLDLTAATARNGR